MKRLNAAALCLLLAAGCNGSSSGADGTTKGARETVFISGVLLIPGDGTPPVERASMIIQDGVIREIGPKLASPRGALTVDLEGRTISPLLINLNAYPGLSNQKEFSAKNYKRESLSADLNRYGYYGVGAILAGGDSDGLAVQVRDELREGKATGAQIYTSGRGIAAKGSFMGSIPLLVTGEADARKAVAETADRNSDAIVLWAEGMRPEAAAAVVDEAHKRKLKVFADAHSLAEAKNLVNAGVDAFIASVREPVDDELVSMLKDKKIPLAPALTALESRFVYAEKPSWLGEQFMREVYPGQLSAYLSAPAVMARHGRNPQIGTFRREFDNATQNLKKLASAGAPIALGSGSGLLDTFPGYFEHREIQLMVDAGMAPLDVFTASTSVPAALLGATDVGILAPGKKANFIVFASNPLEKITNSKDIESIYIDGKNEDRLEMVRSIKVDKLTVSPEDQRAMEEQLRREREEEEDRNLKKYGKFAAGPSMNIAAGLIVPQPKRSRSSPPSPGPPYKVTVQNPRGTGAELREFYAKILPEAKWTVAGDCWEKPKAAQAGKWRLCAEPGNGQVVLTISAP
jgi:imidazolonepropionase-like amidohydrolase